MLCVTQGERGSTGSKGFAGAPGDKVKQDVTNLLTVVIIGSQHAFLLRN